MTHIHLLTLSIAEAQPESETFEINCFNVGSSLEAPIYSFELTKAQVFDDNGKPLWDIGKYTVIESCRQKNPNGPNQVYQAKGNVRLLENRNVSKENLRSIMDYNAISYDDFHKIKHIRLAVVKPRMIRSMEQGMDNNGIIRQRLYVDFDDDHRNQKMLNKDYRWVHFWQRVPESMLREKQEHYVRTLNDAGHTNYLILRRYYYPKRNRYAEWISGMHWL